MKVNGEEKKPMPRYSELHGKDFRIVIRVYIHLSQKRILIIWVLDVDVKGKQAIEWWAGQTTWVRRTHKWSGQAGSEDGFTWWQENAVLPGSELPEVHGLTPPTRWENWNYQLLNSTPSMGSPLRRGLQGPYNGVSKRALLWNILGVRGKTESFAWRHEVIQSILGKPCVMVPVFCRKTWSLRTDGRMHLRPQHLCLWQERQLWFDTEQGPYILQKGSIQTPPSPKWAAAILFPTLNVHLRCDLYLLPEHSEGSQSAYSLPAGLLYAVWKKKLSSSLK